jgi:hypothetical protein
MRIASFTPIWNAEVFIKPHFTMLSELEKNIVFYNPTPWPVYRDYSYESKPDNSIDMIRSMFPHVEIIETDKMGYPELVPLAKEILNDFDIITRLDVDMLMTRHDWTMAINFMRSHSFTSYFTKWSNHTINYYADWDHGLKDAEEQDHIFLPTYEPAIEYEIDWDGWMIHHFRGWNKPKSVGKGFFDQANIRFAYERHPQWFSVPKEIRAMFDPVLVDRWLGRFL